MSIEMQNPVREQVRQVFEYLIEYSRLKSPLKLQVSEYDWNLPMATLPQHPSVQWYVEPPEDQAERVLLRVARPRLQDCPKPPDALLVWLKPGWEKFESRQIELVELAPVAEAESHELPEPAYPPHILEGFEAFRSQRAVWRVEEAPARSAYHLFDRFFGLKGTLDREGERFALTLGDGILRWQTQDGRKVEHPLLGQRCSMHFDPEIPEFTLTFSRRQMEEGVDE